MEVPKYDSYYSIRAHSNAMDSQQQEAMQRYGRGGSRVNASTVIFYPFIEDGPALVKNEDCFNPDKAD